MAIFGFSVTKRTTFRSGNQPFSNIYYYQIDGPGATDASLNAALDEIISNERDLHGVEVTFQSARVWTSGGSPGSNTMRIVRVLSGTGNRAANTSLDRERAILAQWPAGTNILGRPVYLRKWFHMCGNPVAGVWQVAVLQQTQPISQAIRDSLAAGIDNLRFIGGGALDEYELVSDTGRETTGSVIVYPWLEHHQFGNEWREV